MESDLRNFRKETDENRKMQHQVHGQTVAVIDEMRLEQDDLKQTLTRLEKAAEKLTNALEGSLGFSGIVGIQTENTARIVKLENHQLNHRWHILTAGVVGGIFSPIVQLVLDVVKYIPQ